MSVLISKANKLVDRTEINLSKFLDNAYVNVSLKVFLALYAAFAAPKLSRRMALLMDSMIVRVIFATLIIYASLHDPVMALLLAIIFIISLQTAAKFQLYETSESVLAPEGISWLPSAKAKHISPQSTPENRGFIANVGGGLVDGVANVGDGAIRGFNQLGNGVVGGFNQFGTGLVGGVNQFGSGVVGGFNQVGDSVVEGVGQFGSSLLNGVEEVGGGVVSGFQEFGKGVVGSASKIGSGVVGGVDKVGMSVVSGVNQVGTGLVDGVSQLGHGVVGGVRELGQGIIDGVSNVAQPFGLAEEEHYENYTEIPMNKQEKPYNCNFVPFTPDYKFLENSNLVPNADQNSCVQSFGNQYCAF